MPDQADELRRLVAEQRLPVTPLDNAAAMAGLNEILNGTPGEISPPTRGRSMLQGVTDELAKLSSLPPETAEVYRAKLADALMPVDSKEAPILGQPYMQREGRITRRMTDAEVVMYMGRAQSLTDDLITYRRLWLDLKNEALADVLRPSVSSIQTNTDRYNRMERKADEAHRLYDRMEQAETLAFYAHVPPATTETWESVREGLKTGGRRD